MFWFETGTEWYEGRRDAALHGQIVRHADGQEYVSMASVDWGQTSEPAVRLATATALLVLAQRPINAAKLLSTVFLARVPFDGWAITKPELDALMTLPQSPR